MYKVRVNEENILVTQGDSIAVTEALNADYVKFYFDSSWSGLFCYACFKNSNILDEKYIILNEENNWTCAIPHEVLEKPGNLYVGVLGTSTPSNVPTETSANIVKPTMWERLCVVIDGVSSTGQIISDTPSAIQQLTHIAEQAMEDVRGLNSRISDVEEESRDNLNNFISGEYSNFKQLTLVNLSELSQDITREVNEAKSEAHNELTSFINTDFNSLNTNFISFSNRQFVNDIERTINGLKIIYLDGQTKEIELIAEASALGAYLSGNMPTVTKTALGDITKITDYAFYHRDDISSVELPNEVTVVSKYAFAYCSTLAHILLPPFLNKIDSYAFIQCNALTSVTVPGTVTIWGTDIFSQCANLSEITIEEGVQELASNFAYACTGLTKINLPSTLKTITSSAFRGCTNLQSIKLPDSVATIGSQAFYDDSILQNVLISTSRSDAPTIGSSAFYRCNSVASLDYTSIVNIDDTDYYNIISPYTRDIGSNAFQNCSGLTRANLPESLINIGSYAFQGCINLESINIPNQIVYISEYICSGCSKLTSLSIGNSVTTIGASAFNGCTQLANVNLPSSIINIGASAFNQCRAIENITMPRFLTTIGASAFSGCSSLSSVTFEENSALTTIGNYAFQSCANLTSIILPNSVTTIGSQTFAACSALISIKLSTSLSSIPDRCFWNCYQLSEIDVPENVTLISYSSFEGCSGLKTLILRRNNNIVTVNATPLLTSGLESIYVPDNLVDSYKNNTYWGNFANKIKPLSEM